MKKIIAYIAYKILVKYCNHFKNNDDCTGCIFDSKKVYCGCIANIPTEWDKPRGGKNHESMDCYR